MKTTHFLFVILGALFICSCSDILDDASHDELIVEKDYIIPIEDALASLEDFMLETGMRLKTKGDLNGYIEECFTISNPATKSDSTYKDILHVVNFEDNQGYALLSADYRIPDDIIAITDSGHVSGSDFIKPMFDRTPSENDDLSLNEFDQWAESGILAIEQNEVIYECLLYAMRQLETHTNNPEEIGSPCDPGPGGGGIGGSTVAYSWEVVKEVPRMLNTAWTQRTSGNDIFNKYCPEVGLIMRNVAPAGCVCIATAQIVAYHEYPNLTCNDMLIDYPMIKEIYSYDNIWGTGSEVSQEMLARFCICIGGLCNIQYHSIFNKSWGFAWPWNAKSCLEALGYQNVSLNLGYDEAAVLNSLDNGCPVFMSAIARLISGHAWVIDGYIMRDYVSRYGVVSKSQTLVHCNWGWHGNSNGYFTSGIFHVDEVVIPDEESRKQYDDRYWYGFNTITYEKPQN